MEKELIFIIGAGRSGTHLLGRIIGSHRQVKPFIEDERFFHLSNKIATQQIRRSKIKSLISRYKKVFNSVNAPVVMEKSHQNIWMIEELMEAFPYAKFVGIYRDVFSTVASMINHAAVSAWYDILPNDKINPYLGINQENLKYYKNYSVVQKSAIKWKSHYDKLVELQKLFQDKVYVINYNNLLRNQEIELDKLAKFLGLTNEFKPEIFNLESLQKWKKDLTSEQIEMINQVI